MTRLKTITKIIFLTEKPSGAAPNAEGQIGKTGPDGARAYAHGEAG
jgi:hypothetical protein